MTEQEARLLPLGRIVESEGKPLGWVTVKGEHHFKVALYHSQQGASAIIYPYDDYRVGSMADSRRDVCCR